MAKPVAPPAGAWIETGGSDNTVSREVANDVMVSIHAPEFKRRWNMEEKGRSPRGSVD